MDASILTISMGMPADMPCHGRAEQLGNESAF